VKQDEPTEWATDLECGGKRSATPLWIERIIQSAVAVPTTRDSAGALQIASVACFAGSQSFLGS
jgi:hypothetical protein